MPLSAYLTRLIWFCVGPLLLLAVWQAVDHVRTQRAERDQAAANLAQNFAASLDQHLSARINALHMLAVSPLVEDPKRWPELYREAQGFRESFGSHVVFANVGEPMRMLFSTRVPYGEKLPNLPRPKGNAAAPAAVATGKPAVGDTFPGPLTQDTLVAIAVPTMRDGKATHLMLTICETGKFQQRLDQLALPRDWALSLLDGRGQMIARRAPPGFDGSRDVGATGRFVVKSAESPWSLVLEIPRDAYQAPLLAAALELGVGILGATLIGVLGGSLASRRLGKAVAGLASRPAPGAPPPDIVEIAAVRRRLDEAAEEVSRSEERFRRLFNEAPLPLGFVSTEGKLIAHNARFAQVFGYTLADLPTIADWWRLAYPDPDYRARVMDAWNAAVAHAAGRGDDIEGGESRVTCKDGTQRIMLVSGIVLPEGLLTVFFDVSERKQAEEEIRRLNADLEQRVIERTAQLEAAMHEVEDLYDNAPCGYHSLDEDGVFMRINQTEMDWLGCKREEMIGKLRFPDILTEASREVFRQNFPVFKAAGMLRDVEFDLVRKDGSVLPVSISATAIHDAAGAYVASRSTLFDISERRKADAALRERDREITLKNRQLEEADRMKSEFLANMSHELRTPLNAIIGFSEAMRDGLAGEITPEQKEFITDIFNSGEHLLALINDILDLSKVEAGMMTLEAEPVDVSGLLNMGLSVIKEKALNRRIRLKVESEDGLQLSADARKCKQILYNLLANAVKFTPEGGEVRVRVRARCLGHGGIHDPIAEGMAEFRIPLPESSADRFVEITVADTGAGIAADDLGKLFQPFVQLDSSLSRKHHGTGLGLAMVRRLAELHGGTVGVASSEGKGSVFAVWLPLSGQGTGTAPSPPDESRATAPAALPRSPRVLVVEDNEQAATLLRTQLEAEGFSAIHARTAEEALDLLARDKPDVISLDILLPGMDGWEFLGRVKANPALSEIPVVIVSIVAEKRQGFALGAAQVLQKPVTREALAGAMGRVGFKPNANHATILVVDDDPNAVALLAAYLEAAGYTAQRAIGGGEAIEMTRHLLPDLILPDLILLDLMMPDVSGFDVVEALKGDPKTAQIPIIIVTSKEITTEDRATLNGRVEFIVNKSSFSRESFINEVRRALKRRKPRPASAS